MRRLLPLATFVAGVAVGLAVPLLRPAAPATAGAPAPPSTGATGAAEGDRVLASALARGAWTDDDAAEMRRTLAAMAPGDRESLMRRVLEALTTGRLRKEVVGPPF